MATRNSETATENAPARIASRAALGIQAKVALCLVALLAAFAVVGFAGGIARSHDQSLEAASQKSAALADQMDAVWDYIEGHQDVVAESDELATTANGYVCIISAKSVAARFSDMSESTIRYTSLQPRNTQDAPDDFEREAMARRSLEPLQLGEFEFDQAKYTVSKRGKTVPLTPKEFSILYTLACRAGEVVSQRELVQAAWGEGYTEEMAGLAVYVRRIRKKIEDDPANPRVLQTVWGEGYTFRP